MKKMRHVRDGQFGRKEYIKNSTSEEAADYLRLRLEMYDIGNNHGKARKYSCGSEEKLEHIVKCQMVKEKVGETANIEDVKEDDKKKLNEMKEWMKRYLEWRKGDEEDHQ